MKQILLYIGIITGCCVLIVSPIKRPQKGTEVKSDKTITINDNINNTKHNLSPDREE